MIDGTFGAALSGLFGTLVALALVLGLAWVTLKGLRRWQDRGLGGQPGMATRELRFVRALAVGPRERLLLVEAEGELMLIGVAQGSVRLLRNWGGPDLPAPPPPDNRDLVAEPEA